MKLNGKYIRIYQEFERISLRRRYVFKKFATSLLIRSENSAICNCAPPPRRAPRSLHDLQRRSLAPSPGTRRRKCVGWLRGVFSHRLRLGRRRCPPRPCLVAVADAASTADEVVAETASTADEIVAEAASTAEEIRADADAASTADEVGAEATPTADEVIA